MSVNNEYKRYFIILQEDEKGFEVSTGKAPTGYVKIEVKNGRGKLTAFVQNVKNDERADYRLLLIAPNKRTAVEVGRAMLDGSGRGEIYHEFESDNVLNSGLNISEFTVAAVSANNGLPLSGYVGRDKLDWKNKYEIANRPKEDRKDKKIQPLQEIPMTMQAPVIEKHIAPVQEIVPPSMGQQPVMEAVPMPMPMPEKGHAPVVEVPHKVHKKSQPVEEIPLVQKIIPIVQEIPKILPKKEKMKIEEIPIAEEIPVVEEAPVVEAAPVMPEAPHFHIEPKFQLNLEPMIEIKHENITMNQINVEQVEEKEEIEVPCPAPIMEKKPCEEEYDYYCSEESDDSDDRPKHHEHHKHHEEHCEEHEKHCEEHDDPCEEHHSDDDENDDEYECNPFFSSNMYRHLRMLLRRLRRCEPFEDEERGCEWFRIQNEIFMLNDVAVPFMGKMMPLGYPFMMEDSMVMGRKEYLLGVCHNKEHEHEDHKHVKHIMFGIPGMYNKMNERYYMSRGFTKFKKHRDRPFGYWIMCLDIRTGMIKR